ncbi:MAG TPA: SURF1 family protein [Paracoccaceae bacterium]|nr:SURF1 family protein [Paracoccaceae bacterium]
MNRRMIVPLLFGLLGGAILIGLGVWQMQRLAWKEAILADIGARIVAAPADLPVQPTLAEDRYRPVAVAGRLTGEELLVLVSRKQIGPGYRVIAVMETEAGRRILIDRGFLPDAARGLPRAVEALAVTGNLHWPEEVDSFTPAPDARTGVWFARDLPAMAEALRTEPVLVVARSDTGDGIDPMPVDTSAIPNDHLGYAIQWFSLAVVWVGMTAFFLWRIRRRTD